MLATSRNSVAGVRLSARRLRELAGGCVFFEQTAPIDPPDTPPAVLTPSDPSVLLISAEN